MTFITSKIEFEHLSAKLCGSMVSPDKDTCQQAAEDAKLLLTKLPKFLRNSPHCWDEIKAINTLITRVEGM